MSGSVKKPSVHEIPKPENWIGVRHWQFLLLFSLFIVAHGMRSTLSVAIVAMTNNGTNSNVPTYPEWSDKKQLILSSFSWGYFWLQIPAGVLAEKFGPKYFLLGATAITSIFSILIPIFASQFGYMGVVVCRSIQGLAQGFLYPSAHNLMAKWAPLPERAKTLTYVYSGGPLGTVISNLVTGLISDSTAGWPITFYLYGSVSLVWCFLWFAFASNSPTEHKTISIEERNYINAYTDVADDKNANSGKTPWKEIVGSVPVWAILVANCGENWGSWTMFSEIPTYLDKRLGYNLKNNGFISALPYLALTILSFVVSPLADYLIVENYLSISTSRKLFNSIGFFVPAVAAILLGFLGEHQEWVAVVLLIVSVSTCACQYCGFGVNHMDLSPKYAGTLAGITNGLGNVVASAAPLAVAAIESTGLKEGDAELWKIVFCLSAGINIFAGLVFVFFASGKIQSWNYN